jgi:hypothetical protein
VTSDFFPLTAPPPFGETRILGPLWFCSRVCPGDETDPAGDLLDSRGGATAGISGQEEHSFELCGHAPKDGLTLGGSLVRPVPAHRPQLIQRYRKPINRSPRGTGFQCLRKRTRSGHGRPPREDAQRKDLSIPFHASHPLFIDLEPLQRGWRTTVDPDVSLHPPRTSRRSPASARYPLPSVTDRLQARSHRDSTQRDNGERCRRNPGRAWESETDFPRPNAVGTGWIRADQPMDAGMSKWVGEAARRRRMIRSLVARALHHPHPIREIEDRSSNLGKRPTSMDSTHAARSVTHIIVPHRSRRTAVVERRLGRFEGKKRTGGAP